MSVVPAGVHLARAEAFIGRIVLLPDRQRVDIGAQDNAAGRPLAGLRALDLGADTGHGHAPMRHADLVEFALDRCRGLKFLFPQLRVTVKVPAQEYLGIGAAFVSLSVGEYEDVVGILLRP